MPSCVIPVTKTFGDRRSEVAVLVPHVVAFVDEI